MLSIATYPVWADGPVTVDDAIDHLRLDAETVEWPLLRVYLAAASEYAQAFTRRAIAPQTWDLHLDHFPSGPINLPLPPLQSVESITYTDPSGNVREWDEYIVDTVGGRILPAYGKSYPATRAVPNAVTVRFVCGYDQTPESIRNAILLLTGDLYENREGQQPVRLHENKTVERLLWPYRVL